MLGWAGAVLLQWWSQGDRGGVCVCRSVCPMSTHFIQDKLTLNSTNHSGIYKHSYAYIHTHIHTYMYLSTHYRIAYTYIHTISKCLHNMEFCAYSNVICNNHHLRFFMHFLIITMVSAHGALIAPYLKQ